MSRQLRLSAIAATASMIMFAVVAGLGGFGGHSAAGNSGGQWLPGVSASR